MSVAAAVCVVLMMGTSRLQRAIFFYGLSTFLVAIVSISHFFAHDKSPITFAISLLVMGKAVLIPIYLRWLSNRLEVKEDPGHFLPMPLAMHLSIVVLAVAGMPFSICLNGILFMLTRCLAIGQILGFLTLENGVALFAVNQTRQMPMIIEMGASLDVFALVMLGGTFAHRIKKSFEHLDVSSFKEVQD